MSTPVHTAATCTSSTHIDSNLRTTEDPLPITLLPALDDRSLALPALLSTSLPLPTTLLDIARQPGELHPHNGSNVALSVAAAASSSSATVSTSANQQFDYYQMNTVSPHLRCSICTNIFVQPLTHAPCQNTYCSSCIEQWLADGHSHCPICRLEIDEQHTSLVPVPLMVKNMLDDLLVRCPMDDCGVVMPRSELKSHLSSTSLHEIKSKQAVTCHHAGCNEKFSATYIAEHEEEHCPRAVVDCTLASDIGCRWQGKREDEPTHRSECPFAEAARAVEQQRSIATATQLELAGAKFDLGRLNSENRRLQQRLTTSLAVSPPQGPQRRAAFQRAGRHHSSILQSTDESRGANSPPPVLVLDGGRFAINRDTAAHVPYLVPQPKIIQWISKIKAWRSASQGSQPIHLSAEELASLTGTQQREIIRQRSMATPMH